MDAEGNRGGVGALLGGTQSRLASAGIGITTVEQDGLRLAALQMTSGKKDRGRLDEIRGEDAGGGGHCFRDHEAKIVALLAVLGRSALDAAGGGCGGETLGGIHATGDSFQRHMRKLGVGS